MKQESASYSRPVFPGWPIFLLLLTTSCMTGRVGSPESGIIPQTVLKLTPSENNPRNSEGDFVTLKNGSVLFVYTHYTGSSTSDHAPAYLAGRISADGGKSWGQEERVIVENEGDMNVMSVSLLRLQNGKIALFYLKKNSRTDCIPYMRISEDEAETWSDPIPCITGRKGYFVLNNDRVIQLRNGRLLMPVALHAIPGADWRNKADLYCFYSDDNGNSWKAGGQVPDTTSVVTQEPGVIEMKGGRIMMYIRASGGFQHLSFSGDQGETWSPVQSSQIVSPLSPATIEKIPETGDWILVWNNNDGSVAETKGERTPLTVAVSDDEGKTWNKVKNIETDPDGWYCYTAIHFTDPENLLLGYCAGSQSAKSHLSVTNVTRIGKKWLYRD